MGNDMGSISRLGISALATTTPAIEREHLQHLKSLILDIVQANISEEMGRCISREVLLDCLSKITVFLHLPLIYIIS